MASQIVELSDIISTSVADLLQLSTANGWLLPSLKEPFNPATNAFRSNPSAAEAATKIIAAATQLAHTLMGPSQALQTITGGPMKAAALRVCLDLNVAEVLRDAGPEGLHVADITAKSGSRVDAAKLARLMRFLANSFVFREVRPDVFANSMPSSLLDTRKPVKDLLNNPSAKHDGTPGPIALWEFAFDDISKASSVLLENMTDPKTAFSDRTNHAPFQRIFQHDLPLYDWYELPEQEYRRRRFGAAMTGLAALQGESILSEFEWNKLPENSIVVDVGGGIGASARFIAETAPQVRIIVQDKPGVVEAGVQAWKGHSPEMLTSERVVFQSHDFFKPQPVKEPAVFVLKNILHNWGDSYNIETLTQLRAVATPDTKLLIVGVIIPHVCGPEGGNGSGPLLPNYGPASEWLYIFDMVMMNCFNAREYTLDSLRELLRKSGWKLDKICDTGMFHGSKQMQVASPI